MTTRYGDCDEPASLIECGQNIMFDQFQPEISSQKNFPV